MVYHSSFNADAGSKHPVACGCALPPLKGGSRGPAREMVGDGMDIVDEVLYYLRSVLLFRTYDVQGAGDKTLIYLTLFASQCLKRLSAAKTRDAGAKQVAAAAADNGFKLPGDAGFLLGGLLPTAATKQEAELFRGYMRQAREQLALRLLDKCYREDGTPNPFWIAFHHRKFLGKDMNRVEL